MNISEMVDRLPKGGGPARAIKGIFVLQLVLGLLLFGGDLISVLPQMLQPSDAPAYDQPVAPGDQTRRFQPREMPARPFESVDTGPMPRRILLEQDGTVLTLTGEISPGDGGRFADYVEGAEPFDTLVLMSPGGSVSDALAIGRMVREAGVVTRMPAGHFCLSACPYILASGVTRSVHEDAQVGVHQHYFGESTVLPAYLAVEDIQRGQAEVMAYLDEMGVDPLVMRHAMETPPDEIYILLPEELERYALATEVLSEG